MKRSEQFVSCVGTIAIAAVVAMTWAAPAAAQSDDKQQKPMQKSDKTLTAVSIDDIEENAATYRGKTVKVTGEIDEVYGPRIFKLDEKEWIDFDGEMLVFLPAPLAALVTEGAPVTVTGTVRSFTDVDLEKEWGWFEVEPDIEAEFNTRPIIVADAVTSREGLDLALRIDFDPAMKPKAVGTSGSPKPMLTSVNDLAAASDDNLVGRMVDLQNARVGSMAKDGGFWVNAGSEQLFVLPAAAGAAKATTGQTVSIQGVVLEMPDGVADRLGDRETIGDEEIYVYATQINAMK